MSTVVKTSPLPNRNYSAPQNIEVKCASRLGTRRVGGGMGGCLAGGIGKV